MVTRRISKVPEQIAEHLEYKYAAFGVGTQSF